MHNNITKKYLLKQCDIEDEDNVQENTAARTPLKKNTYGPSIGFKIYASYNGH